MQDRIITNSRIAEYREYLIREEKSKLTKDKYMRDIRTFCEFLGERPATKELVMAYKKRCLDRGYAVRSVNSMLASVNGFLAYLGWHDCRVKSVRFQQQTYCAEEKELTKEEYLRLLNAAKGNPQFYLVMQSICGTGIRVSELQYFTVESIEKGYVTVRCKSKTRTVMIPGKLKKLLMAHARRQSITTGPIFCGKSGKPLDRSVIWRNMKRLCEAAGVCASKVFPHNLRKLFARMFYGIERDIAKLADILGHSSINTTRIYIMTTGTEHRRMIERLGLVI